jgi:beta-glucanase (GH16 family)
MFLKKVQKGLPVRTKLLSQIGLLVLFIMAFTLMIAASITPAYAQSAWTQIWADEFSAASGTGVNTSNWFYDTGTCYPGCPASNWGTGEIQTYTNSTANVYHNGAGQLVIKAIRSGSSWTSGRIESQRSNFQPPSGGAMAIEGRLQLPNVTGAAAQGYWPAFWTLGAPFRGVYTNWPSAGEIDIMENVNGANTVWGTLHCGVNPGGPCNETTGLGGNRSGFSPSLQGGYHTYRIEFDKGVSPQQIRWYVDGILYHTVNANQMDATTWNNATNHGFFILLNVAMGGGWPGNPTSSTASGASMLVDYVRVYTRTGGSTQPTATPVPSGDFTHGVTVSGTTATIRFTSNVNSAWVDVHYTLNSAGQQNFRMSRNGNVWTQNVAGVSTGSTLRYWFTYEKSGLAYDTTTYTYTR